MNESFSFMYRHGVLSRKYECRQRFQSRSLIVPLFLFERFLRSCHLKNTTETHIYIKIFVAYKWIQIAPY